MSSLHYVSRVTPHPYIEGSSILVMDDRRVHVRDPGEFVPPPGVWVMLRDAATSRDAGGVRSYGRMDELRFFANSEIKGVVPRNVLREMTLCSLFYGDIGAFACSKEESDIGPMTCDEIVAWPSTDEDAELTVYAENPDGIVVKFGSKTDRADSRGSPITLASTEFDRRVRRGVSMFGGGYAVVCVGKTAVAVWNVVDGSYVAVGCDRRICEDVIKIPFARISDTSDILLLRGRVFASFSSRISNNVGTLAKNVNGRRMDIKVCPGEIV